MIRTDNYIIIPVEVSSFVMEVTEDGKLKLVGNQRGEDMETVMNEARRIVAGYADRQRNALEQTLKNWKRYNVSKEYMSEAELDFSKVIWEKFNEAEFTALSTSMTESFERSLFELTDVMLEYDIAIHKIDSEDKENVKEVSLDVISKLLGNLSNK